MDFEYFRLPTGDPEHPWIGRPLIEVSLSNKSRFVVTLALIDSGADYSLFHTSLGTKLGLDTEIGRIREFKAASGDTFPAYFHTIELRIIGTTEKVQMEVGFTDSPGVTAVLGQADFFQAYQINFQRYRNLFQLKRATKSSLPNNPHGGPVY